LPRFNLISAFGSIAFSSCGSAVAVSFGLGFLRKIFFIISNALDVFHLANMIFDAVELRLY